MSYSEALLVRIRRALANRTDVTEQKMFGGIAFMVRGHMACGPHGDSLIVRIGEGAVAKALKEPHVGPMDFTGRVLKPFAYVRPEGVRTDAQVRRWARMAAEFAAALPAKPAKKAAGPKDAKKQVARTGTSGVQGRKRSP
jgi:TfoX/Sxy family transcriptional regulator of competence genes